MIKYVNDHICSKLTDARKWVIPLALGSLIPTLEQKYRDHKEILKAMGFVDVFNITAIEKIYTQFHDISSKTGPIDQYIPLLKSVRFDVSDVDAVYRIIRETASATPQGL
mgnify:FL=1